MSWDGFESDAERLEQVALYMEMVNYQIGALDLATGFNWEHIGTGGNCDALVAYYGDEGDSGYVMLTCDACVIELGSDTYGTIGLYTHEDECEAEDFASFGDEYGQPLALAEIVSSVVDALKVWGLLS